MGRLLAGGAGEDRVVAVIDPLDPDDRLLPRVARVVARPLAERALHRGLVGRDLAFEHDFRIRRERQPGHLALDAVDRPAGQPSGPVELGHVVGQGVARGDIGGGIDADDDRHRAGLARLEVLVALDPPLLAVGDVGGRDIRAVHLHAVGADIDPPAVGVAGDDAAGGSDIAPAVVLVVDRHRELEQVDIAVAVDVFHHRAVIDRAGRDRLMALDAAAVGIEHGPPVARICRVDAESKREPKRRAQHAVKAAHAPGVSRHLVEQEQRRLVDLLPVEHLGHRAELAVPVGARDVLDLSAVLNGRKKGPQVGLYLVVTLHRPILKRRPPRIVSAAVPWHFGPYPRLSRRDNPTSRGTPWRARARAR